MKRRRTHYKKCTASQRIARLAAAMIAACAVTSPQGAFAHDGDIDFSVIPKGTSGLLPDTWKFPGQHGVMMPLLPVHAMGVHQTLVWKRSDVSAGVRWPGLLMFQRHSAYTMDEVANPDVIHFLIDNPNPQTGLNCFGSQANQFNSAFRRSFNQFCYGGYNIIHDVSTSVPTKINDDWFREITVLWNMNHPAAFKYNTANPKYSNALLNNSDAVINGAAFVDMGNSKNLHYDMYCPGFATLEDGRPVFAGGHDMNSQNGLYRTQIFNPDKQEWVNRPISCMRDIYGLDPADPYLETLYKNTVAALAAQGRDMREAFIPRDYVISKLGEPVAQSISGDCNPHDLPGTEGDGIYYSAEYPKIRLAGVPNTSPDYNPDDFEGGTVTQPGRLTSDMRYARWYPTQVALPGNKLFIFAGWDRDEKNPPAGTQVAATTQALVPFINAKAQNPSLYPDLPVNADLAGQLRSSGQDLDAAFLSSRTKPPVSEVYNAATDSWVALENARLYHTAWYPNGTVVQTGPGRDDWKVFVLNGEPWPSIKAKAAALPTPVSPEMFGGTDSQFRKTWLVDVQAALADPNRDTPTNVEDTTNYVEDDPVRSTFKGTGKYLTYVDEAPNGLSPFSANANIIELGAKGEVLKHTLTHFGGQVANQGTNTADGCQIDFASLAVAGPKVKKGQTPPPVAMPKWRVLGYEDTSVDPPVFKKVQLYQRARQNYATPLPDGTTVILGGNGGTLPSMEAWSLHLQHYVPAGHPWHTRLMPGMTLAEAKDMPESITRLAKSLIRRDEHGIIHLMADGTVYCGGQNRNGIVGSGDPDAPLGDPDLGVPCGQIYRPPYLYDENGNPADRPVIIAGPSTVKYGKPFKVTAYAPKGIRQISLIRTGSMSHALYTDCRLVKLTHKAGKDKNGTSTVTVYPPKLPGTAIGGYYYLFVVDNDGVPSISKTLVLGDEVDKRLKAEAKGEKLKAKTLAKN